MVFWRPEAWDPKYYRIFDVYNICMYLHNSPKKIKAIINCCAIKHQTRNTTDEHGHKNTMAYGRKMSKAKHHPALTDTLKQ